MVDITEILGGYAFHCSYVMVGIEDNSHIFSGVEIIIEFENLIFNVG